MVAHDRTRSHERSHAAGQLRGQGVTYLPSTPPIGTGPAAIQQRPNPFVGPTLSWFFNGTASYHAGNVSLIKRSSRGLTFKTNYSFSKVLDLNSASLVAS